MNPTPEELEAMVMGAWMKSPLRDELAELLVNEKVSGGSVLKHKVAILGALGDWATIFLFFDLPLACTPNNIVRLREVLEADVIERAKEILTERGYTRED